MPQRTRTIALFVALAALLVADVIAVAWLDEHEVEVIGIAACALLFVWMGVVLTDPSLNVESSNE